MTGSPLSPVVVPDAAPVRRTGEAAPARIVDAAIRCIVREGVVGASMAAIAAEAGVSKALLHYHYADRAQLLAEAVGVIAGRIVAREAAALGEAEGKAAVDALWHYIEGELVRGELRALLELATVREPQVRAASARAAEQRRAAATRSVTDLFARLRVTPRVPLPPVGTASLALIDGLAHDGERTVQEARGSFDVFWLALLSLAI